MGNLRKDVALTIAVSMELFVYGIYATVFASTCGIIISRQSLRRTHSTAWVFRVAALVTFILSSLHICMQLYRFLRAFVITDGPKGGVEYMYGLSGWPTVFSTSVFVVVVWISNALLLIRCFYVWNKNMWIILTPVLLQLTVMATSIYLLSWLHNLDKPTRHLSFSSGVAMYRAVYVVAVTQNIITSGLISLKIYIQRATFGASSPTRQTLGTMADTLLRDMVESASFYLILNILVTILYFAHSNAIYIFQNMLIPTAGIVFLFMAIRVQTAKATEPPKRSGLSNLRGWLATNEDSGTQFSSSKQANQPPGGVVSIRVSVDNFDLRDDFTDPAASSSTSSYPHKRNKVHPCDSPL